MWAVGGVVLTAVAQMALMGAPEYANYLPLASLPVLLAVFVPMYLGLRARPVRLRVQSHNVRLQSARSVWVGAVERTQVVPWIVAGLGTAQGATLLLHARDREGKPRTLAVAAAGAAVAVDLHAPASQVAPEFFLHPPDLQKLIEHFAKQPDVSKETTQTPSAENRFVLVRRPGLHDAMGSMLPWFGTLAVLGIAGALLGERLATHPSGMLLFALFSVLVIGFGLWKTMQRSRAPKPRFELLVQSDQLTVASADGTNLWHCSGKPRLARETYVYRTRYSTHRFAMIKVGDKGHELRLAVWDPSFAREGDPRGSAPDFLVGVPDWPRLERVLQATQR